MFCPGEPSARAGARRRQTALPIAYESMNTLLDLISEAAHDACTSRFAPSPSTVWPASRAWRIDGSSANPDDFGRRARLKGGHGHSWSCAPASIGENNIAWAERTSRASCAVIYGAEGFKCHSKICQLTYHDQGRIERITLLGTGNFNEKTARLYSDFMLMTAHEGIGEDANAFFRNLTLGNLHGEYRYLGVAPRGLKPLVMDGLDRRDRPSHAPGMPAHANCFR
ncbi:MAG: hypothetical protein ACLTSX_07500 [Collinsella sp.]